MDEKQKNLKKTNPQEYYSQSSLKFQELCRDSEKVRKEIEKISTEIEVSKTKLTTLKSSLSTKKELFGIITNAINARI